MKEKIFSLRGLLSRKNTSLKPIPDGDWEGTLLAVYWTVCRLLDTQLGISIARGNAVAVLLVHNMIGYPVPRNTRQTTGPARPELFGGKTTLLPASPSYLGSVVFAVFAVLVAFVMLEQSQLRLVASLGIYNVAQLSLTSTRLPVL